MFWFLYRGFRKRTRPFLCVFVCEGVCVCLCITLAFTSLFCISIQIIIHFKFIFVWVYWSLFEIQINNFTQLTEAQACKYVKYSDNLLNSYKDQIRCKLFVWRLSTFGACHFHTMTDTTLEFKTFDCQNWVKFDLIHSILKQ